MELKQPRNYWAFILLFLVSQTSLAEEILLPRGQVHVRSGVISGSLSGPISSSFTTMPTLEIEHETFFNRKRSSIIQGVLAIEQTSSKSRYIYVGYGQRFYFNRSNAHPIIASGSRNFIEIKPKWRYFAQWEAGISNVLVQEVTRTFDAVSTMVDFGGGVGASYQLFEKVSIEANGKFSYGYGFTSVAVNALIMKISFGATYFF